MKPPVLHSAFLALLGLLLSPMAVTYLPCLPACCRQAEQACASPTSADSVHFSCQLVDHEQLERDRPHPAAKRLAELNVGEPRTVRLIYFLPNDRPFRAEVVDSENWHSRGSKFLCRADAGTRLRQQNLPHRNR